jgi:predicted TPR repeat methyltransferase
MERCSNDYVRDTFDSFAESFDSVLARLNYQAPQQVAEIVGALCRGQKVANMVDLGCGTGLVGPMVREYCDHLIGVDLSKKMMQYAGAREVYDQLVCAELGEYLQYIGPGTLQLAVSADTLCYVGALETVFAGLAQALCEGGAFVGTVESSDEDGDYILDESGRFKHRLDYVNRCAAAYGLQMRVANKTVLRLELGVPVSGLVFVLERLSA